VDKQTREVMTNIVRLFAKLKPGQTVTREELLDYFSKPLTHNEDDAALKHAFRYYVKYRGLSYANEIVSYEEAAKLAGCTVDALRAASYRRSLQTTTEHMEIGGNRRKRTGCFLYHLAEYCNWSFTEFQAACDQVSEWRKAK